MGQCFLIYSFFGWLLEGGFQWFVKGNFHKPNFLHTPLKPMYGIAAMLLASSYKYDRRHFRYHCCLLPLLVELVSGLWLERKFHLKYWDYSQERFQLGGYICLKFALCWIVLAQLLVHLVQPMVELLLKAVGKIPAWRVLYQLFLFDCLVTMHDRRQACVQGLVKQPGSGT